MCVPTVEVRFCAGDCDNLLGKAEIPIPMRMVHIGSGAAMVADPSEFDKRFRRGAEAFKAAFEAD